MYLHVDRSQVKKYLSHKGMRRKKLGMRCICLKKPHIMKCHCHLI